MSINSSTRNTQFEMTTTDLRTPTSSQPKVKRSRTGCITCRNRHKKCDEAKPICKSCQQRQAFCEWPIKGILKGGKNNKKKKSKPNNSQKVFGTNYHQIINGELNKILLENLPENKLDRNNNNLNNNNNSDNAKNFIQDLQNAGRFFDPLQDLGIDTNNNTNLNQNRSESVTSNSPSLFSNNSSVNVQQNYPSGGSSPASDIEYQHKRIDEDSILKSFQFTSSSQFLSVPEAEKFIPSHNLFKDFLFTNVILNNEKEKIENSIDTTHDVSTNLMLSEFNLSLKEESEELNNKRIFQEQQKDQYFKILSNQASKLFENSKAESNELADLHDLYINNKDFNIYAFTTVSQTVVSINEKNELVQNFMKTILPLLNMSSTSKKLISNILFASFADVTNNAKANTDDYLICAILALSSRILDLKHNNPLANYHPTNPASFNKATIALYNKSLKLMIDTMKPKINETIDVTGDSLLQTTVLSNIAEDFDKEKIQILTTCLILFLLQVLSSAPKDYKLYLESLLIFIKSFKINGFNNNPKSHPRINKILNQFFWLIIRFDIYFSINFSESPLIASSSYLQIEKLNDRSLNSIKHFFLTYSLNDRLIDDESYADNYCNYLYYLGAKCLELIYNINLTNNLEEYTNQWEILRNEFEKWHENRPIELQSIVNNNHIDNSNHSKVEIQPNSFEIKFPIILYNGAVSTSVNQLFHTLQILLYQHQKFQNNLTNQIEFDSIVEETRISNMIVNATKVIAISLNDVNSGSLNLSLAFNYIASSVLSQNSSKKTNGVVFYYDSKIIMKKLLKHEQSNCWPLRWKFNDF